MTRLRTALDRTRGTEPRRITDDTSPGGGKAPLPGPTGMARLEEAQGTGGKPDAPGSEGTEGIGSSRKTEAPERIRPGWNTADVVRAQKEAEGRAAPFRAAADRLKQYAEIAKTLEPNTAPDYLGEIERYDAGEPEETPDYQAVLEEYDRDPPSRERVEELEKKADSLLHRAKAAEELAEEYNAMTPALVKPGEMDWNPEEIGAWQQQGFDLRQQAGELTQQAREKRIEAEQERQRYDVWKYEQFMEEYAPLKQSADWAEQSQADPDRMMPRRDPQYALKYDASGNFIGTGILDSGYEDLQYAIINGDEDAFSIQAMEDSNSLGTLDHSYLLQMNEYEREFYNYLYNIQGKKAADEYLDGLSPWLNVRERQKNAEIWKGYSDENQALTSAFSVLISPMKAASYFGQTADYLEDGKIDQNAAYNRFVHIPDDIRSQVSKITEEHWGKTGSNLYKVGMKFADFLFGKAVSGGSDAIELAILGTKAAADTVVELRDRGVDSKRAFILGAAAGLAEIVADNASFETVLKPQKLADKTIMLILNKAIAGGSEGVTSDILKWAMDDVYDLLTGQSESRWKQDIREKQRQGMSFREAAIEVLKEKIMETGLDAVEGALENLFH